MRLDLPIGPWRKEAWHFDLAKGTCAEWFRIDGAVKELFDVAVITGHACPMSIGPNAPEIIKFVTHAG
jgi:hypothetical protein